MERLDLLGFLLITVNCNMTIVGKIWLIFMVLLRMVVIILAGSPVYQDEQERFVCNTLQPGCANVCYDIFSPVSQLRFWLIQSVSVLLPSAIFSVYVLHRGAVLAARGLCPYNLTVPDFSSSYIVHLFLRVLTEAAFGASHYLLFGFLVPKRFSCTHAPCTSVVDCYVSRPTEKSIMMLFMWAVSALSLLLSVADLFCSVRGRTSRGRAPAKDPLGHTAGRPLSRSLGARSDPMAGSGAWVEEGAPIHPGLWTGAEGADSPSGKSAVSGRMGLRDEDESEVLSSASEKLAAACKEPGSRAQVEASQDPRVEGPTRSEEHLLVSRSRLGRRYPSGQLPPPDGLANSRSRKSEWV
uniref:Gap junction protein n=1 Tax=Neovison vison TaxID=452646 RepID=A0A8C7B8P0_NEOVI